MTEKKEGRKRVKSERRRAAAAEAGGTHRAALVEGDGREIDSFKQVLEGHALARAVLVEHHLAAGTS